MTLPSPRDLIKRHQLTAHRALGQHYLLDEAINRRIAEASGAAEGAAFIETGPGPGSLTCALLEAGAAHIWAIERDKRFLAPLGEISQQADGRLEVISGDALKFNIAPMAEQAREKGWSLHLVGNLPYQIAAPLILRWLEQAQGLGIASMSFLIQEEMAKRLTAQAGSRAWGRFSVICQFLAQVESLFSIAADDFTPPPKVAGRLVRLVPRQLGEREAALRSWLEKAITAGFGQRRKMLRVSLRQLADDGEALARTAGLDPQARAESVPLARWLELARVLEEKGRAC